MSFELKINNEIMECLPHLSKDELKSLEDNILKNGIREPLVVYKGFIIDGHNRYSIAKKYNLKFETIEYNFSSKNQALLWIIDNQLGRRNLTDFSRAELALKQKEYLANEAKERQGTRTDLENSNIVQNSTQGRTVEHLSKIANVSRDTIQRTEYIQNNSSQSDIDELRQGTKSINKVYTETRSNNDSQYKEKTKRKKRTVEDIKREAHEYYSNNPEALKELRNKRNRKTFDEQRDEMRQYYKDNPDIARQILNRSCSSLSTFITVENIEDHIESIDNNGEMVKFCMNVIKICKKHINKLNVVS